MLHPRHLAPALLILACAAAGEETENERRLAKAAKWKGEKLTLLGEAPVTCPQLRVPHMGTTPYNVEGRPERIPTAAYVGKRATIVDVRPGSSSPDVVLEIEGSIEHVVASLDEVLGFDSELEEAKKWAGRSIWVKGSQWLRPVDKPCQDSLLMQDRIETKNLQHLTVVRAEPGTTGQRVWFLVRTDAGTEGWLDGYMDSFQFDEAHTDYLTRPFRSHVLTEDPRKKHAAWKPAIWTLIDEGKVALGMTAEMATLACGRRMSEVGTTIGPKQQIGKIYECNGQRFRVEGGTVVKYGE